MTMIVKYAFQTSGERLFYHVQTQLLNGVDWPRLAAGLLPSGRADELTLLFYEIASMNTTCRLVQAAKSLRKNADGHNRVIGDASYQTELKRYLREVVLVPAEQIGSTLRLSSDAAAAAASSISDTTRRRIFQKAYNRGETCYLCNCELDYDSKGTFRSFEIEHLWPNSYGGNSEESNLLPVCQGCNKHKADLVSWGMAGIQSLVLGINPSQDALSLRGDLSFAVHYFAARRLLKKYPQRSLKWAMQRLGPRQARARAIDSNEVADFFNLEIHCPKVPI